MLELVIQENIDILCVTETWLTLDDKVKFREIDGFGFSIISQPRMGRGGGIAFIFKLGLPIKQNCVQKFESFEACEAILNTNCESICLRLIYRPVSHQKIKQIMRTQRSLCS